MADDAWFWDFLNQVKAEFPPIFALINQPGILDLALRAVSARESGQPMSDTQLIDALHATPFWQNTPESARNYITLSATDPATATQQQGQFAEQLKQWAATNGFAMSDSDATYIAAASLAGGVDIDQAKRNVLDLQYKKLLDSSVYKGASPVSDAMQQQASQYGVPLSDMSLLDWQRHILRGDADMNTFNAYLAEQAKSLYPGLSAAIDSGITVRQYADPYAQIAQQELGINPNDFQLSDPKWSAALNQIDPKTGARTAMTLQSWQAMVRSDPAYGYDNTTNARDQAAQFATHLAQQFGAFG